METSNIEHFKFEKIHSTQEYLIKEKENYSSLFAPTLVSAKIQDQGKGRRGHEWIHFKNSLCFSFTLNSCDSISLIPLEMSLILIEFFKKYYDKQIKVKWPNDLYTKELKKIGGIIANNLGHAIVVGIGLNWAGNTNQEQTFSYDYLFQDQAKFEPDDYHNIPIEIYRYILENRLASQEVIQLFEKNCFHINQKISIAEDREYQGTFTGIDEFGRAIIVDESGKIQRHSTGHLILNSKN